MSEQFALLLPALALALLHFLWQGLLIGAAAALALRVLRHARPQARYAVACVALLACLVVPVVTLLAQLTPNVGVAVAEAGLSLDAPRVAASTPAATSIASGWNATQPWIVLLWALGACLVAARMALGLVWVRGLPPSPSVALGAEWQLRLDALARRFGLRRRIALRLVERLDTPATFGCFRPVVLLPVAMISRLPADLIEALLAHELAHIRRHDYLVSLVQAMVEALLFYHPVVWWLSHRIRSEREEVADQLAADHACPPRRLASALSELAEWQATHAAPRLAPAARGGSLLRRIERLLLPAPRARPGTRLALVLAGLGAACIATLAYAQATHRVDLPAVSPSEAAAPRATVRDTYVLVHDGRASAWGPRDSADVEALALGLDGDFFFAHRAGTFYVVTDPALVEQVRRPWRELESLEREIAVLDAAYGRALQPQEETTREAQQGEDAARALSLRLNGLQRAQNRLGEQIERDSRDVLDTALARGIARPAPVRVASLR